MPMHTSLPLNHTTPRLSASQGDRCSLLFSFYTSSKSSVGEEREINTHISNFLPLWLVYHSPNQYLQKYINEAACVTKSGSIFWATVKEKKEVSEPRGSDQSLPRLFQGTEPSHLTYLEGSERKRAKQKDFPGWLALYRSPKWALSLCHNNLSCQ